MVLLSAPDAAKRLFWHRHSVAAHQSFDPPLGVNDALLTRPEGVTDAADFDVNLFLRGARDQVFHAASAKDFGFGIVRRMDVGFHLVKATYCFTQPTRLR